MKKLFLFLIFAVTFSYAQNLVEDNDITENRKEMGRQNISYDLNNPVEFYRLKCENPIYAPVSYTHLDVYKRQMQN